MRMESSSDSILRMIYFETWLRFKSNFFKLLFSCHYPDNKTLHHWRKKYLWNYNKEKFFKKSHKEHRMHTFKFRRWQISLYYNCLSNVTTIEAFQKILRNNIGVMGQEILRIMLGKNSDTLIPLFCRRFYWFWGIPLSYKG